MFLAAQTAVLAATFTPTTLTAAALGLLGGICLNVSIDGALSILPAFAYFLSRSPSPLAGLRLACIAGLVGIIAAVVPFSPENVSPLQYYHLFQVTSRHPWQRWVFEQNVVFAAMLLLPLLPLLGMYALFRPKLPVAFKWFIATLVLSVTLETFPAAESGRGPTTCCFFFLLSSGASSCCVERSGPAYRTPAQGPGTRVFRWA